MKRIFFFIGLLLTFSNLAAQKKVTENTKSNSIDDVYIHVKFANNIEIKQWDKKEISVEATVNIDENKHNDYFNLQADKVGSTYTVKSDYGEYFKKYRSYSRGRHNHSNDKEKDNCDCDCHDHSMEINYVIYVPKEMEMKIKSISGGVKLDTYIGNLEIDLISGDIDVKKHSKEMTLKTISGDIDIYVSDATFDAKTLSGSIYSDLDIDFSKNTKNSHSTRIRATVKNGSARLKLNTISGDIFLRKR